MAKSTTKTRRHNRRAKAKEEVKIKAMDDVSSNEIASHDDSFADSCCSTPKGKEYRIPDILSCPPAPKKRRVASNCLLKRSPIAFFSSPDMEMFFCNIRNVPA